MARGRRRGASGIDALEGGRPLATPTAASVAEVRRLPTNVLRKVEPPEKPGPMPLVRLAMSLLFLFLVAFAAWVIGWWPVTCLFCVLPFVGLAGARSVARRFARAALGRADAAPSPEGPARDDPSPAAPADEAAASGLGGFLADPEDPRRAMLTAPLRPHLRARIERNRAAEAGECAAWLARRGGPEGVDVASGDGCALHARVFRAEPTGAGAGGRQRWVVLLHDYRGSWEEAMPLVRRYVEAGFSAVVCDLRACGESAGEWVGLGYLDSLDVVAWARWAVGEGARSVVLHGSGMGAAAALMAAGEEDLPGEVAAVVAENCYTDAWTAARCLYHGLGLDVHPAMDLVRLYLRHQPGGYDMAAASPQEYLRDLRVGVLFLQGARDTLVPPYMSTLLWRSACELTPQLDHRIESFDKAGHLTLELAEPERYWRTVFDFLSRRV
jgi:hypothetical protein